jgi:hypothetical protein
MEFRRYVLMRGCDCAKGQSRAFRREHSNSHCTPLALRSNAFQRPNYLLMIAYLH